MELTKHITETGSAKSGEIAQNFFWMSWSGVISIANSVLVWTVMARMRDVDEVGRFTIVMGFYSLFYSIVSLGLMSYLVNEISRRSLNLSGSSPAGFVGSSAVFLTISGVICALLMSAAGLIVSSSWQVQVSTMVLSLAMIPTGLGAVCEANAIAHGRARLVAAVSTVENLLRTIVPLWLIWFGYDLFSICVAFSAVRFIAVIIYLAAGRFRVRSVAFSYSDFRQIARVCPTFAGTIIASSINWQAPLFMLGYLSTETASADFGAASRFLIPVTILMASYGNVLQPALARFKGGQAGNCGRYLAKMAAYPVIGAIAIAFGSLLLSRQVLTVVFGSHYESAAPVLNLLALSVIPFCLVIVAARGLVAIDSPRIDLIGNAIGVVVCVLTGIVLIPSHGAVGAAASLLFSFILMAVFDVTCLLRKTSAFNMWKTASLSSAGLIATYTVLWN